MKMGNNNHIFLGGSPNFISFDLREFPSQAKVRSTRHLLGEMPSTGLIFGNSDLRFFLLLCGFSQPTTA